MSDAALPARPGDGDHLGKRHLSTIHAVAQALALGPMLGVALVLAGIAGPAAAGFNATLSVVVGSAGVLGLGYVISLFARRYAGAGTVYEYLTHGGSRRWGVLGTFLYFVGIVWIAAGAYLGVGVLATGFFQEHLSLDIPWWVCVLVAVTVVQVITYLGVRIATRVMLVMAACGFVPMLFLALVVIAKGGRGGNTLAVFSPSSTSGSHVLDGLLLAVTLFVGFEAAAAIGEESREPHKSIPRAVLWTVGISGLFYALMTYAFSIAYGQKSVNAGVWLADPGYLNTTATHYVGAWLGTILSLVVIFDGLAVSLALCVSIGHGFYSLARENFLPRAFRKTSKYDTPWLGNLTVAVSAVVAVILAATIHYGKTLGVGSDPFAWFFVAATAGTYLVLLIYLLLALLAFRLVAQDRGANGQWWRYLVVLVGVAVPILAYKGSLFPIPADLSTSISYVALWWMLGTAGVSVVWFAYLWIRRSAELENAGSHASVSDVAVTPTLEIANIVSSGSS